MSSQDRFLRVMLRLTEDERTELERQSILRDEKPATLARKLVVDGLRASHVESTTPAAKVDRRS